MPLIINEMVTVVERSSGEYQHGARATGADEPEKKMREWLDVNVERKERLRND